MLDRTWVFRFARPGRDREALGGPERAVLAALERHVRFAIPRFEHVSRSGDVAGYRLIEGEPLTVERYRRLSRGAREGFLDAIAGFLRQIHRLPAAILDQGDGTIAREWSGALWRRRWRDERRAQAAQFAPAALVARADRFYDAFAAAAPPPREVVTHGDLSADHMLLAPDGQTLAGVIDFGDVCLGDPAYDCAFFFAYGEAAAHDLIGRYEGAVGDPGFVERGRRAYSRFRIEQLRQDWPDLDERIGEIHAQFDRLGVA